MDNLRRARRPHRMEATKLVTEITALLDVPEVDARKVRTKIKLLREAKEKLLDLDEKILNQHVDDQSDERVEDDEFKVIREYREKIENILDLAEELLQQSRPRSPTPSDSASNTEKRRNFKLPEIELKKYNGDLKGWLGFWSQFEKIHDDETLHSSDKFQYLLQAMEKGSQARELVESYPQSGENYEMAVAALKDRFGDKDLLLQVYVRELLNLVISNVTAKVKIPLPRLYMKLESHLRSLATLELAKADPATWLYPLVESSLDSETLRTWQRSPQIKMDYIEGDDGKTRLELLMDFLKTEVQIEQRIKVVQAGFQQQNSQPEFKRPPEKTNRNPKRQRESEENLPTAAGLFTAQESTCIFCEGKHDSKTCYKAKGMPMEEKQAKLKSKGACYSCLRPGHTKRKCRAFVSCHLCPKKHVTILCPLLHQTWEPGKTGNGQQDSSHNADKPNSSVHPQQGKPPVKPTTTAQQSSVSCVRDLLLMTLKVNVSLEGGLHAVTKRLLIDSGCQRSSIRTSVVEEIGSNPIGQEMSRNLLFDGSVTKYAVTKIHRVTVSGVDGKHSLVLELREKPVLGGGIPLVPVGPWLKTLRSKGIWIADAHEQLDREEIDIVIGKDYWWQIKTGNEEKLTDSLGATETIFGWTLSGKLPSSERYADETISMFQLEEECSKLWSMEAIGIKEPISKLSKREEETFALQLFQQTTTREENGRYKIKLPWVNGPQNLPTNRKIAEQRLNSTTRKLDKMGLYEAYDKIFHDWLEEDFVEIVDPDSLEESQKWHYICHHPVFKNSLTTPTRPVFDASCKVGRNPSLNDLLFKGPNMIELLPAVIMRFRMKKLGVVSDIRKAFQMVVVSEDDRNYLLFLWWEKKHMKLKVFRHKRVVFGVNCSPYLLAAVLGLHLKSVTDRKDVAEKLLEALYVDNVATSVDSYAEYIDFKTESIRIMEEAKMDLRQWEVTFDNENEVDGDEAGCSSTKVLGLIWDKKSDILSVSIPEPDNITFTKRGILSTISRIFDPIGFVCPAVFTGKVLFQKAWKSKSGWDTALEGPIRDGYLQWVNEIPFLKEIKIPRHHQIHGATAIELHLFCDGSQLGYACAVFLKSQDNEETSVQLVAARSRLAPLEKGTIPRLELCACVIGARQLHAVKNALNLTSVTTYCWSDSTTAIAWIQKNDDWGTFVGNRVKEILEVTLPEDWRHVAGINNPADLPSRGCSPSQLLQSRWWEGPDWLSEQSAPYCCSGEMYDEEIVNSEKKKTRLAMMEGYVHGWYQPKFSSYLKNVKVLGWIRRFYSNAKGQSVVRGKHLLMREVRRAELDMVKIIQLEFYDSEPKHKTLPVVKTDDGLLRVKTALILNNDDTEDFRWPLLLPGKHPLVHMLISEAHLFFGHVGTQRLVGILRERFWITQTKKTVSKVIHKCVICQRYDAKAIEVEPAPLPVRRVQIGEVFTTVGVDLAGPLFIRDQSKVWIVLYTCAVYRCVWLDLVTSLDTIAFLQSLERFIANHGRPTTIYSDNGTNFVGANNLFKSLDWKDIEKESEVKQIKWIFNPPTASWWGGFWERLVKSVKDLLRRMLGRSKLSFEELRTCLAAVMSTINERPLTTFTEDPQDFMPLTPAAFMKGTRGTTFPEGEVISQRDLQGQYAKMTKMKDALQARFRKEYLGLLVRKPISKCWLPVLGQLVLVGSDNKKRYNWPLGRIVEIIPGQDGIVRTVKVRIATGVITRPAQRIYPLEIPETSELPSSKQKLHREEEEEQEVESKDVARSRFGRKLNKPVFYGKWNY